jgi:Zn-dependent protease with chaperone function
VTEDKSTRYHRLKRRTEAAGLLWGATLLVGLAASGGALLLRDNVHYLTGDHRYGAVGAFVVALLGAHEVVALPLAWYSGYALEHRYGLSRQRPGAWLVDHVKGAVLGLLLAVAGALIVYGAIAWADGWWWLLAGCVFAILTVGLAHLAPVLLLPLFFTFVPLRRDQLRTRLEALAARAGTRIVGVYEWALGAKTRKANAALTGVGRTRRILVSDTMLEQYSDDEIEVVLAHELGHHLHHDIWRALALESSLVLAGFLAADLALTRLGPSLGIEGRGDPAGLPLLAASVGLVSLLLMPVGLALSRRHERRADRFALDLTGNTEAFQSAMKRLGAQNLAEEKPSRLVQWLFYSHPPLEERLDAARRWAAVRQGPGPVSVGS